MNACWDNRCVVMSFSVFERMGRSNSKVRCLWSVVKFSAVPVEKRNTFPCWYKLVYVDLQLIFFEKPHGDTSIQNITGF